MFRFLPVGVISVIAVAGTCGFVHAQSEIILAEHLDNSDPETEGWSRFRPFNNVASFPVTNDLGIGVDAWAVDDNGQGVGQDGLYGVNLSNDQISEAMAGGWVLRGNLRVVNASSSLDGAVHLGFLTEPAAGGQRFGLNLGVNSSGNPVVNLLGEAGEIELTDLDDGYHLYELVFDPDANTADFFVDGMIRFSDYAGVTLASAPGAATPSVAFGSAAADGTGQGNYQLVQFAILQVPEAGSVFCWAMVAFVGAAIGFGRWRRGRTQPQS